MTPDAYPLVTIVAGDIKPVRPTTAERGAFLQMSGGAIYIQITTEQAAQWLPVIEAIAGEK